MSKRLITATLLGAALTISSPLVLAQGMQQGTQQQAAPQQAPAQEFSEGQLNNFADSYIDIMEIQEDFTAQLERADEPDAAQRLQQEANEEMIQAIESNGLDVQEYTSIARAMDGDPELRQQVVELVSERQ